MSDLLADAAFGAGPGIYPLPSAATAEQSWYRSIALAGQGRYSQAWAESLRAPLGFSAGPHDVQLSLLASTRASWMRQLGGHVRARALDGRAAALAFAANGRADIVVEARCDALTGLAADALGVGRFALAGRLLERCSDELNAANGPLRPELWRPRLRLLWVRSELAMASGHGDVAVRHALAAADAASDADSLRHRVKTDLILAAAHCVAGDDDSAEAMARGVAEQCVLHGLVPLRWAASMLLVGLGAGSEWEKVRDAMASCIEDRGGVLS